MKTLIATFTSALALLALAAGGASAKSAAPACATEGKTIKKTSTMRIYTTSAKVQGGRAAVVEPRTYGCLLKTGDRLRLDFRCTSENVEDGDLETCLDRPGKIVIRGPYVALVISTQVRIADDAYFDSVVLAKVGRDADIRIAFDRGTETVIDRMFISPAGALAFAARVRWDDEEDESDPEIHYAGPLRAGRTLVRRNLDIGGEASTKSLRVRNGTLTWTSGGKVRTAPFK